MNRIIIDQPHHLQVIEDDLPIPKPHEVLLSVKAVGICGSDLHVFEGLHPFVTYPVLPGHEVCGVVCELGSEVDPSWLGKTVALEPSIIGGDLPNFEPGRYNICSDLKVMGFQATGAMAHYFAVSVDRLHILPDHFSYEVGAMLEPLAVAVHAVQLLGNIAGRKVAVIGAGTIGLLTAQVVRAYGAASVQIADLSPKRREFAQLLNLETLERLPEGAFDLVFECVGLEATAQAAILACRKGATVGILGVYAQNVSIPLGLIQDRELRLIGSLMYVGDDFKEAIRLIDQQQVLVLPLITHRFLLNQAPEAFQTALEREGVLKVILRSTE